MIPDRSQTDMIPWTLIARFSNKDAKHWMNDSGYWWYDKTEAAGQTTDPLSNADMISPAFFRSRSRAVMTPGTLLCYRPQVTVWVDRHSALKSQAMVTSEMTNGPRTSVWGIAYCSMVDNTIKQKVLNRQDVMGQCKASIRSDSGAIWDGAAPC